MTILTEDALEFAKEHISKYYDSDFFPKPVEFEALWHNWGDVKKELTSKNIQKLWIPPPRVMAAMKPKGGYRVVHQLEPLESIVYTALAREVAEAVEAARMPAAENVACSYRLKPADGSFFSGGSGYSEFVEKTEILAKEHLYVLITDITDFYNQIYLHRLNNAIEHANPSLKPVGDDIEWFITFLNSKSSQGIPVGPAASIVMAEAILIDIDLFLQNRGAAHTRYVDDFRIFGESERVLAQIQQDLTVYLYENHRLTLSGEKTNIVNAAVYVQKQLHNQYAEERMQIFKSLEVFNPYTEEIEEVEYEVEDEEELLAERVTAVIDKILDYEVLDLGLARSAIRKAKRYGIDILAKPLIENYDFFGPVINDVVLYLKKITSNEVAKALAPEFAKLLDHKVFDNELVRFWTEWYFAQYPAFLGNPDIRAFVHKTPFVENRALAAITEHDIAWVREMKSEIFHLGSWDRRAVLNAARVLPGDEREHWLKLTIGSSPILLDRWVAKWVLETA